AKDCMRAWSMVRLKRFGRSAATAAGVVATLLVTPAPAPAQTRECTAANGCMGYRQGLRVFAQNPRVQGVIGHDEHFIDLGTKTFKGQACPNGVIRVGHNSDRVFDPNATQDTTEHAGAEGGRPIESCAP